MRITGLYLRDVGPFEELTLDLPPGTDPTRADAYVLAGENGTGKTTALLCIAEAVGQGFTALGSTGASLRMRSEHSRIEVQTPHGVSIVSANQVASSVLAPDEKVFDRGGRDGLNYGATGTTPAANATWAVPAAMLRNATDFAAFSYSGTRRLSPVTVAAIKNIDDPPLASVFDPASKTGLFAQWIANTRAEAAFAAEDNDLGRARALRADIEAISECLSKVTQQRIVVGGGVRGGDFSPWIEVDGNRLTFDVLPEGLKSLLSWLGDLMMRLSRTQWSDGQTVRHHEFLLLMDEIEVHLHPRWQRRVVPVIQSFFPRAQIIASTHSPFVVGSASDARVYPLVLDGGRSRLMLAHELAMGPDYEPRRGLGPQTGVSYPVIVEHIFGIPSEFDPDTEQLLEEFRALRTRALGGAPPPVARELFAKMNALASRSSELAEIMAAERRQLRRALGQEFERAASDTTA